MNLIKLSDDLVHNMNFEEYRALIDSELKTFLSQQSDYDMYKHMEYFLGFIDEDFNTIQSKSGKRFRPCLTLLLSESFGDIKKGLSAALSIELLHNFTLIHDDIVDNDEERRGRPTVWKLWGKDHAINSGDGQHTLVSLVLLQNTYLNSDILIHVQKFLHTKYLEVCEGQFLDFSLTTASLGDETMVNESAYFEMIGKKTATLIGASIAVAGVAVEKPKEVQDMLYEYGFTLGLAYQVRDDYASIWIDRGLTGKRELGDLIEKKKTLPVLHARDRLKNSLKKELVSLYDSKEELTIVQANRVLELLESVDADSYVKEKVDGLSKKAETLLQKLDLPEETKTVLQKLTTTLLSI